MSFEDDIVPPSDFGARLKDADPDRYRAALFADKRVKEQLFTLYAFHAELAKVPEMVSEPIAGQIRYQWWRDAVDEIYSNKPVRRHEVATVLSQVLRKTAVPRFWVDQLIDAREQDLESPPFANMQAAKTYAASTSGTLMRIAAHIAAPDMGMSNDLEAGIEQAGLAWGLSGLVRAYGYYHETMLAELSFEALIEAAQAAHMSARTSLGAIPSAIVPAIAYTTLVPTFTGGFPKDFDPKLHKRHVGPLKKQVKLLKAVFSGKI